MSGDLKSLRMSMNYIVTAFIGVCLPLDSSFDQGRGRERGLRQHPVQRHLGKFYQLTPDLNLNQIGSTWVVTAAHCLYKEGELVDAKSLSILLGLHNRSKKSESKRCHSRSDQHHDS